MRTISIFLLLVGGGLAFCVAQPQEQNDAAAESDIAALQKQRIKLLEQRVDEVESAIKLGLVDRYQLILSQMDLINVRLDYAHSKAEKKGLLLSLLKNYDQLIDFAELQLKAPPAHSKPGQRTSSNGPTAASKLLFFKSERVRIQIELKTVSQTR